jgi:hypothetical protein
MKLVCISNKTQSEHLEIGKIYEFDKDPFNKNQIWVYIEANGLINKVCYSSDFITIEDW